MGQLDAWTDQEADRLSNIMVNDPHFAANEMRNEIQQLQQMGPNGQQTISALIGKTKNDEYVGGMGDLQIQVERDQQGQDTGYRNVTMATQDGIEQIAEVQAQRIPYGQAGYDQNNGYGVNPLGLVAGVVIGDLLWQQQRGMDFNDGQYRGWSNREQGREQNWNQNSGQFQQNWNNPTFRSQYQNQNWQTSAYQPTANNTYITNNRIDTTTVNAPVNTTKINETINNTRTATTNNDQVYRQTVINNPHQTVINNPHQTIANPAATTIARPATPASQPQRPAEHLPVAQPGTPNTGRPQEKPVIAAPVQPLHPPTAAAPPERTQGPTALQKQQAAEQAQRDAAARAAAHPTPEAPRQAAPAQRPAAAVHEAPRQAAPPQHPAAAVHEAPRPAAAAAPAKPLEKKP